MRKFVSFLGAFVLMFSFFSCSMTREGIEEFHASSSSYGVCDKLVPEQLLENYEHIEGDYFFHSDSYVETKRLMCVDKALMYLVYDSSTYTLAKDYVFENMVLDDTIFEELNGYVFYINMRYDNILEEQSYGDKYPYFYNMVAFNDVKNEIVFLGLYVPYYYYEYSGGEEAKSNFSEHLKHFYGEWYNFFD